MIDVTLDDTPAPAVDPRPQPQPAPAPQPALVPVAPGREVGWRDWLHIALFCTTLALIVVVGGDLIWKVMRRETRPGPAPTPAPVVDAYHTGRQFTPILGSTYGDAWLAAAEAMESGKSVPDAQKILQEKWKDARTKEFMAKVKPVFEAVMPEGSDPGDPARRRAIAALWRDFARGLKEGR